jgi:hypothetical protein
MDAHFSTALLVLRWLHIFSAAVGLGVALLHPLLIQRLRQRWPNPELVNLIISIERWYIVPAHVGMVLSGFGLIYLSELYIIDESWLWSSILLMAMVVGIHHLAFLPLLKHLNSAELPQIPLQRMTWVSRVAGAMVLIILTLMIAQPGRS